MILRSRFHSIFRMLLAWAADNSFLEAHDFMDWLDEAVCWINKSALKWDLIAGVLEIIVVHSNWWARHLFCFILIMGGIIPLCPQQWTVYQEDGLLIHIKNRTRCGLSRIFSCGGASSYLKPKTVLFETVQTSDLPICSLTKWILLTEWVQTLLNT